MSLAHILPPPTWKVPPAGRSGLGVLLLLGLTAGCGQGSEAAVDRAESVPAPAADRVVSVSTQVVTLRQVVDVSNLPADVLPLRRAVLAAEVAGTVDSLRVAEGSPVRAGQVLLEVDTRSLEQLLAEAEAVDRQRRAQFERAEALLERRSITQQQFLDAVTQRDVAAAQLASARLELDKSKVRAPWAGTVTRKRVEVGDYVTPGQPAIELLDASRVKVRAPAPSSDVPFLRVGLPARVRVDSLPGEVFEGQLARLAAELDASSRTLDIEIEIPNRDGRLRPGMVARLELPRRVLDDAALVPLDAVVELEDRQVVYVVADDRAEQRSVTLGPVVGGDQVVVADGLVPGDTVIVEGQRRVSPGQRVHIEASGEIAQGGAP